MPNDIDKLEACFIDLTGNAQVIEKMCDHGFVPDEGLRWLLYQVADRVRQSSEVVDRLVDASFMPDGGRTACAQSSLQH